MKSSLVSLFLILPACFNHLSYGQMLDSLDQVYIDSALTLIRLTPEELGFDKLWVEDDTFRLAIVEDILNNPLQLAPYIDRTKEAVDSSYRKPFDLIRFIDEQLTVDRRKSRRLIRKRPGATFDPADPFLVWKDALDAAEPFRQGFYAELDSLELHDLIMEAPVMWSEAEDSVDNLRRGEWHRRFNVDVDTSREADSDRLLDIIAKLDMHSLMAAASIVVPAAQITAKGFGQTGFTGETVSGEIGGVIGEVLYYEDTEWGRFVVGGVGDNVYHGDFAVIIDIGGDDVYRGRTGGALGILGNSYSMVVDLSGDDYYDSGGEAVSHGAGFFGIGILIDRDGNDSYRSGSYSQGAGFFGVGVLADHGGDDDRRGEFFMQGAAHCGIGILIDDEGGDDRYLASTWAQGFGATFGYGLLYDSGGDDNYRTGGVYLHEPLLPHDNKSFAGGFGMGWRPRAGGGIGVLYDDGDGNDFYDGEVMCFGSSYWYSLGILIEGGGNDYYSLAHYGLGTGIHLSVGGLYDAGGDDQYRSRFGVVGATPHDLSVGMMVDASGDDYYIVSDGWGASLTNSVGVFIDRLGNDTYATRGQGYSFGNVKWTRGFAGAALFLDLEGDDVYPASEPAADSSVWIRSGWGIGMDLPRDVVDDEKKADVGEITLTAEDSARSVEDLFEDASLWEVGSARETVRRARKALLAKGVEGIVYVIDEKLDTRSGLQFRTIEEVVKALPDTAGSLLTTKLTEVDDYQTRKNALSLLGTLEWAPSVVSIMQLLKNRKAEKNWNSAISALGKIGDKQAANLIETFIESKQERRRIATVRALGALKVTATIPSLVDRLNDADFTVRSAAALTLIGFGKKAETELIKYVSDSNGKYPELAVRALGRIAQAVKDSSGSSQAKLVFRLTRFFEDKLDSEDEHVRAAAVESLYRIAGEATRQMIAARMESEFSVIVRAAYKRVETEMGG